MKIIKGSFGMLFGQRKNKQFNYKSRINKEDNKSSEDKPQFEFSWAQESKYRQQKSNKLFSLPFLLFFLVLIAVLWFVLGRYE